MTSKPVETTKAFQNRPTQAESNYVPLSASSTEACANCRFFLNDGCWIIANDPEPIIATGYCDRWEATPAPAQDATEAIVEAVTEAVESIAETVSTMPSMYVEMSTDSKPKRKSFSERVRDLFTPKPIDEAFSVFKGIDDQWHWHAVYTNNFEDREGEILTEKAHDNYIQRLDMGLIPMPVLMAWHTPGTEHGEADIVWLNKHFVHAVGHFYDTPIAKKALQFYQKNVGKIKMSHGFVVPEWGFDGKHYDDYNTIEITTLPPYAAANPYTSFEELKTMQKEMTDEKRRYLKGFVSDAELAKIEAADEQRSKALEDLKVEYKDFAQVTPTKPTTPPTETEKALSAAYGDVASGVDELLGIVQLQAKAIKAADDKYKLLETKFDTETAAWQKELDKVKAQINLPPTRASQASSTVVAKEDNLGDKLPTGDPVDNFFKGMGVAMKGNA